VCPEPEIDGRLRQLALANFATAFSVDKSLEEAFNAVKNIRGWWSEEIKGSTDKVGDEFTYHYRDIHRCTMRLTEAVPGKKVVWLVLDNYFDFTEDKSEWKGTKISFEISRKGDLTLLLLRRLQALHRQHRSERRAFEIDSLLGRLLQVLPETSRKQVDRL
jgi:hypothetical protein